MKVHEAVWPNPSLAVYVTITGIPGITKMPGLWVFWTETWPELSEAMVAGSVHVRETGIWLLASKTYSVTSPGHMTVGSSLSTVTNNETWQKKVEEHHKRGKYNATHFFFHSMRTKITSWLKQAGHILLSSRVNFVPEAVPTYYPCAYLNVLPFVSLPY